MASSSTPEHQEHGRSPPETVTAASDESQPPQLPSLGDPTTGRSAPAPSALVLAPTPLSSMKQVSAPHPCPEKNIVPAAASNGGEKQCVRCGATETPQWRIQPVGMAALCNACRIRLRPAEALREPLRVHLAPTATATATTVISQSSPAGGYAYLMKVTSPSGEKSPFPAPAPAKAPAEKKKQERKRVPSHPRKTSTWWPTTTGPSTLCNRDAARLLQQQECRPAASPKFEPHPEVLQPHQKKHRGKERNQPPQPAAMQPRAGDGVEQHAGGDELMMVEPISKENQWLLDAMVRVGGDLKMVADQSSLDQFLFGGPSAPMLIDEEEEEEDLAD